VLHRVSNRCRVQLTQDRLLPGIRTNLRNSRDKTNRGATQPTRGLRGAETDQLLVIEIDIAEDQEHPRTGEEKMIATNAAALETATVPSGNEIVLEALLVWRAKRSDRRKVADDSLCDLSLNIN